MPEILDDVLSDMEAEVQDRGALATLEDLLARATAAGILSAEQQDECELAVGVFESFVRWYHGDPEDGVAGHA